jgi:hypothetical protein
MWDNKFAKIEQARRSGKLAVGKAATAEEVETGKLAAITALQAV